MGFCESKRNTENKSSNSHYDCIYDKKELSNKLNDCLRQSFIQDSSSNEKNKLDDSTNDLIKKKEIEELLNYYHSIKDSFIQDISKYLMFRNLYFLQNLTSEILSNEAAINIYKQKIINEISKIKENEKSFKINYLTIMLVGKNGVGKSTLINSLLRLKGKEWPKQQLGALEQLKQKLIKIEKCPI